MGQLASGITPQTTSAAGQRLSGRVSPYARSVKTRQLVVVLLGISLATVVFAQSGRNQPKTPKAAPAKPKASGSIARPSGSPIPPARPVNTPVNTSAPPRDSPAENSSDDIDEADTIRVSSNLVPIPASVVDLKGTAVTGLKLEDFELRVDGQPRAISDIARTETSVRLAMLFDNSGSLDFARDFEKQAARHFFRQVMRPTDEAAIYSIETESYLAQPLTSNIQLLERTIDNFGKPEGATSLFDAIIDAAAYLRPYKGRLVLVIVSDGVETSSRNSEFDFTLQKALAADCQIFIVQTGLYDGANLRALAAERRMEQLSGQTGGAVYVPKTVEQLNDAFVQIAADLAHQYILSYYPSDERRDGRFHNIELRVKERKDVRVRARRGYYSPRASNLAATGI